jgi:very-short-patch-repair endonuclease
VADDERFNRTRKKTERARALRKTVSRSEARLWLYLRAGQLGASFRRQHPIGPYFADYYCAQLALVIEADGPQHDALYDARRDAFMEARGLMVLRFRMHEIVEGIDGVVIAIRDAIRVRKWERGMDV